MSDNAKKQYPGYLKGKKVRIQESSGQIVIGTLREITDYHNTRLLVVELGTDRITSLT